MPRRSTAPGGAHARISAIGGQVIQKQVTPALADLLHITSEPIPPVATDSGHRTTPDVFGFGLLDAVPDAVILARADPLDRNGDGISGRPNRTADGRLGRFGRKAQAATLREFNGDAFVMEMGITNPVNQTEQTVGGEPLPAGVDPLPEPEISAAQFDAANAFVRFLAPPPRAPLDPAGVLGTLVFAKIGCSACHVPALVTGARRQSRRPSRSTAGRASGHETGSSGCRASSGPRCCSSSGRCSRYDPFRTNVIVATGFTRPPTTKCRVAARDVAFLGLVSLSAAL